MGVGLSSGETEEVISRNEFGGQ